MLRSFAILPRRLWSTLLGRSMADLMVVRGWYLADEVGRLAGVSAREIGQWARRGYIQSSQSNGRPRVYSYEDVAEAMIVHELIERSVPSREIANIVRALRREYGDWPLTTAPLVTSNRGGAPKVLLEEDGRHYDLGAAGAYQEWLDPVHLEQVRDLLKRGGWAIRDHPDIVHIEVTPDRLSGRPTIRGRRVPAELVGQLGRDEAQGEYLRNSYDLDDEEIRDAVRWYEATQAFESVAA